MNGALRLAFFALVVRPLVYLVLGVNVRHRERLPATGPASLGANHNSHLDALALMSLFPLRMLGRLRPVAAADYFLKNRVLAWFALRILGILPLERRVRGRTDVLAGVCDALDAGAIVILFPEGSRGEPECLAEFKTGVAHLAKRRPDVPVTPVFLHGLGKSLPKGEALLVPFPCDVCVGEPVPWQDDKAGFMAELGTRMQALCEDAHCPAWD